MSHKLSFLVLLLFFSELTAQNEYGLKSPNYLEKEYQEFCGPLESRFRMKPKEVGFGIRQDSKMNLYFQFNDKEWFQSLFVDVYDGIAIDIVEKDLYDCKVPELPDDVRGEILKPIYSNKLKNNIKPVRKRFYEVWVGKLPPKYFHKEIEFNIIFLQKRFICRYQRQYNLNSYNYELLDMGLYTDSLSYKDDFKALDGDEFDTKYKTLTFKIPFQKNKSNFSQKDIKPLYDSLKLTDFSIKKIDILAYSSVEGSLENNIALQQKRSKSIVNALQSFQTPSIKTTIATAENWVEFLQDISNTEYEYLKDFSKDKIKQAISEESSLKFEPILKNHRKALITLYLQKKEFYQNLSNEKLVEQFNLSISKDSLTEAEKLQNSLFERIKSNSVSPDVLYELQIPKQRKFVDFFNANSAFRYRLSNNNLLNSYYEFQELHKLDPDNKKVAYNMLALKLRMNHAFKSIPEEEALVKKIKSLESLGINEGLVQRMLVNYHIIKSELLLQNGQYEEKDDSVSFINEAYSGIPLSDSDYLSLAQFLSYYSNRDSAIDLLSDKVNTINVDKKLLFYFLNLTLVDDSQTEDDDYRVIMLNAINQDKNRFCKLFNSSQKGGVTFQLLDNEYLRRTYCENCVD